MEFGENFVAKQHGWFDYPYFLVCFSLFKTVSFGSMVRLVLCYLTDQVSNYRNNHLACRGKGVRLCALITLTALMEVPCIGHPSVHFSSKSCFRFFWFSSNIHCVYLLFGFGVVMQLFTFDKFFYFVSDFNYS